MNSTETTSWRMSATTGAIRFKLTIYYRNVCLGKLSHLHLPMTVFATLFRVSWWNNMLTCIWHGITPCCDQLQKYIICHFKETWFTIWLTCPLPDTTYPLPLTTCPLNTVTPPAIAFTACKSVFRIDFFKDHPSYDFVSYWVIKIYIKCDAFDVFGYSKVWIISVPYLHVKAF